MKNYAVIARGTLPSRWLRNFIISQTRVMWVNVARRHYRSANKIAGDRVNVMRFQLDSLTFRVKVSPLLRLSSWRNSLSQEARETMEQMVDKWRGKQGKRINQLILSRSSWTPRLEFSQKPESRIDSDIRRIPNRSKHKERKKTRIEDAYVS